MVEWENMRLSPIAHVTDVLGMPGDMKAEGDAILAQYGFPLRFPPEVEKECDAISHEITKDEIAKRRDFRDILTFHYRSSRRKGFLMMPSHFKS